MSSLATQVAGQSRLEEFGRGGLRLGRLNRACVCFRGRRHSCVLGRRCRGARRAGHAEAFESSASGGLVRLPLSLHCVTRRRGCVSISRIYPGLGLGRLLVLCFR